MIISVLRFAGVPVFDSRRITLKYCPIMKSFALLLLFCQLAFSADPPKFGWKKLGEETFSLGATAHKDFRLPKGRLLFQFKAEEAIYAGVATAEQYAPFKAGKYLELANFESFHCVKTDLIEGVQQCNVTVPNAVLAIRDKRGPGTQVLGAYSVLHPLDRGAMADRATKPNKVRVTLYGWACIENCIASNP